MRATALLVTVLFLVIAGHAAGAESKGFRCHGEPATYVGTPGSDRLHDSGGELGDPPVVVLRGGDDRLGLAIVSDATVCAGGGDDEISITTNFEGDLVIADGGAGDDELLTSGSTDILARPFMHLSGGPGDDVLRGANARDRIAGGSGEDVLAGEYGQDKLRGGPGGDRLFGQGGRDSLIGQDGDDLAHGGGQRDSCRAEKKVSCEA